MDQVIGLFPTPVMRAERLLPADLIEELAGEILGARKVGNFKSGQLSHTEIMHPDAKAAFRKASKLIVPKLAEFGTLLFGEKLDWSIKEVWTNLLEHGGHQSVHTHANSFISGVLYLTPSHNSANLTFHKSLGGTDFIFSNQNKNTRFGPFNGTKWVMPAITAGDLVLFPSYLLHEVPANQGEQRISVAFNAIPSRLESFGYSIKFS